MCVASFTLKHQLSFIIVSFDISCRILAVIVSDWTTLMMLPIFAAAKRV